MTQSVCVLGGTGFVGKPLLLRLAEAGYNVTATTRRKNRHAALLNYPNLTLVEANLHDPAQLREACQGHDVVINLVGVLNNGRGNASYQDAHIDLAKNLAQVVEEAGIDRLIHLSAAGADASLASSAYLQSKGEAESIFKIQAGRHVATTIFRPSIIFGTGGGFVALFSKLLDSTPFLPLACANAKVAPIWVEDVVTAVVAAINNPETYGQSYDLCGEPHTMLEVVQALKQAQQKRSHLLPLSAGWSKLQAMLLGLLPGKPFTLDNYDALQQQPSCAQPPVYLHPHHMKPYRHWVREEMHHHPAKQHYGDYRKGAGR